MRQLQLRETTIVTLLKTAFSVRSLPRCLKQDKSRIYSVGRQSPASKGLNTQAEEADIGSRYQTMTGEDIAD